jgi:protoporphyrinogen oxidase
MPRRAFTIGAGPAGLTAALELLRRTDVIPVVLEKSQYMGGISRTVAYKGNRTDIGGHRFFSKNDRAMEWWLDILPTKTRAAAAGGAAAAPCNHSRAIFSDEIPLSSFRVSTIRRAQSTIRAQSNAW